MRQFSLYKKEETCVQNYVKIMLNYFEKAEVH